MLRSLGIIVEIILLYIYILYAVWCHGRVTNRYEHVINSSLMLCVCPHDILCIYIYIYYYN